MPAAASEIASAWATSPFESCSKCRISTTSRSVSSSCSMAAAKRISSSWCVAAAAGVNSRSATMAARSNAARSPSAGRSNGCSRSTLRRGHVGACGGRRSAGRGPGASATGETACRSCPGNRVNRRFASTSTSCTMSLASSRRCEHRIHPHGDHPPQRLAMALEQLVARRRVTRPRSAEQLLSLRRIGPHACQYSRPWPKRAAARRLALAGATSAARWRCWQPEPLGLRRPAPRGRGHYAWDR